MIRSFLQRRREFRARVQREAAELITFLDDHAYGAARKRMREARDHGDRAREHLWSKVAVEIARRTGHQIGKEGGAKWPDAERIARGELRPPLEPTTFHPNRREIADRLVDISRGIVTLSKGEADAVTLHNIGVAARQILAFTGRTAALERAVDDLLTSCRKVEDAPTMVSLSAGIYPLAVEEAGRALRQLRALTLR